ncbi:hypothetical protein F164LOC_16735 [Pectobacterium carotovorum]|nr:hypothetical protein F164LOC_16735 [Pectobacterium carotovorum]
MSKLKQLFKKYKTVLSLVFSGIGLIGTLDDLNSWAEFIKYIASKASAIKIDDFFYFLATVVHGISVYWRFFFHTIFDYLTSWIPLHIPPLIKDIIIISMFVFFGKKRAFRIFINSLDVEQNIISKIVHKYLKNTGEKFIRFSISDAKSYYLTNSVEHSILENHEINNIKKFNRCFSSDAKNFALDVLTHPELIDIKKQHLKALHLYEKVEKIIYLISAIVILFLILDYISLKEMVF